MGQIISFTGAHGTGKTTSVLKKSREIKIQYPQASVFILQEVASFCPLPINQKTTADSQLWIFATQIKRELELCSSWDIVISDRTCIDAVAYTYRAGFHDLAERMFSLASLNLHLYKEIYFKTIKNNNYHFSDGVRDCSDKTFRCEIEIILKNYYSRLGLFDSPGFFIV
jgi:predicted ATPase